MYKIKKGMLQRTGKVIFFTAAFLLTASCASLPAQEYDEFDEVENLLLDELEEEPVVIQENLQDNFIIIEPVRVHELNPQLTTYSIDSQISTGLYEGLFTYNPVTLEPEYAICQNYKVSRDKKRVTFYLRQNARFSDGTLITASDVKESWITLLSIPNAPYASLLDIIRGAKEYRTGTGTKDSVGISVISDFELAVYLNSPANYLPRLLCHSSFSVVNKNPYVSSGAYCLAANQDELLILVKNPYYWDYDNTIMNQITFVQSDDSEENAYCYNCGLVDWITGNVKTEKLIQKDTIIISATFGTGYYFFKNSCKKPAADKTAFHPWDHVEFRSAVLEAFPWEEVRKNFYVPATTFVYPQEGYPVVEGFDYTDQQEALRKMNAARKKYNIPENQIIPLNFEISEYTLSEDKLEIIKKALEPLGIQLNVIKKTDFEYLGGVSSSDSDMFAYTWIGDFIDPLAFLTIFQGESTLNDSGWKNSDFDALVEQAAVCSKDEERFRLLAEAEEILLDDAMVLPIYRPVSVNVIDMQETGGWTPNSFDLHPLKYLYRKAEVLNIPNIVKK